MHTSSASVPAEPHPSSTASVQTVRHRAELPTLAAFSVLTVLGVLAAVVAISRGVELSPQLIIPLGGLVAPIAGLALIRVLFWQSKSNGIEVSADQLPELHTEFNRLVDQMGFDQRPRLLVTNGNGVLNAFSSKCSTRRGFVVINSDLLDLITEFDDWDTVRFVLAHELGHIRCGHVDLWRLAIRPVPRLLSLDGWLVRTQEYTADRFAAQYCADPARQLLVLYAGKRMYRHVNFDAHLDVITRDTDSFWLRISNLLSGHPVGHRRLAALTELGKGVDAHGRMC